MQNQLDFALSANGVTQEQADRDMTQRVDFYVWGRDLCQALLKRQETMHRRRFERGIVLNCYHWGNQRIIRRPAGGLIVEPIQNSDQPLVTHNYFRPYADEVIATWGQSHPQLQWAALAQDKRQQRISRRVFQQLQNHWENLWLTEKVRQQIALSGLLNAGYGYEVYYDPDDTNGSEWVEEYAPVNDPARAFYECANPNCPTPEGELNPAMSRDYCPSCGSSDVLVRQYDAVEGERLADAYFQQAGEVVIKPVNDLQVRYDLTVGREDSLYLYIEEDRPTEEVEYRLNRRMPGTASNQAWADEDIMHPLRFLRRVGRFEMMGGENDDRHHTLCQRFYLEPALYAFVVLDKPATLPNGEVLPVNTRLIERFPKGFSILTVPGADQFLGIDEGSHKRRFRWGHYGIANGRHDGYGADDAREPQRQINIFRSAFMRGLQKFLIPSIAVNTNVFRNARLFNLPDQVIPIKQGELPDRTTVKDHFASIESPSFHPQLFELLHLLEADIQRGIKAYNSNGDAPGVQNETATAAQIALNKTTTAQNLHLALNAGALKETFSLALEIAQEYYGELRQVKAFNQQTRLRQSAEIKAADLRQQYMCWVKSGSYLPNLDIEKQARLLEGANTKTALLNAGIPDAEANRLVNKYFSLDLGEMEEDVINEQLEDLLMLWEGQLQATGGMILPEELNAMRPVDVQKLGNMQALQAARLWLTEESDFADPIIVAAMRMRIEMLFQAVAQENYLTQYAAQGGDMAQQAALQQQASQMAVANAMAPEDRQGKQPQPNPSGSKSRAANPLM